MTGTKVFGRRSILLSFLFIVFATGSIFVGKGVRAQTDVAKVLITFETEPCPTAILDPAIRLCDEAHKALKDYADELAIFLKARGDLKPNQVEVFQYDLRGANSHRQDVRTMIRSNRIGVLMNLKFSKDGSTRSKVLGGGSSGALKTRYKIAAELHDTSPLWTNTEDNTFGVMVGRTVDFAFTGEEKKSLQELAPHTINFINPNVFDELTTIILCVDFPSTTNSPSDGITEASFKRMLWSSFAGSIKDTLPQYWNSNDSFQDFAMRHNLSKARFLHPGPDDHLTCKAGPHKAKWKKYNDWVHYQLEIEVVPSENGTASILITKSNQPAEQSMLGKGFYYLSLKDPDEGKLTSCLTAQFHEDRQRCAVEVDGPPNGGD